MPMPMVRLPPMFAGDVSGRAPGVRPRAVVRASAGWPSDSPAIEAADKAAAVPRKRRRVTFDGCNESFMFPLNSVISRCRSLCVVVRRRRPRIDAK